MYIFYSVLLTLLTIQCEARIKPKGPKGKQKQICGWLESLWNPFLLTFVLFLFSFCSSPVLLFPFPFPFKFTLFLLLFSLLPLSLFFFVVVVIVVVVFFFIFFLLLLINVNLSFFYFLSFLQNKGACRLTNNCLFLAVDLNYILPYL